MMSGHGSYPRRMIPGHASPGRPAPNLNALTLPPFRYLPEAARCFGIRLLPSLKLSSFWTYPNLDVCQMGLGLTQITDMMAN